MGVIILNTVFMASKTDRMSPLHENIMKNANFIFAFIFNVEMVLKLIGLGQDYFSENWHIFDFSIVILTDFGIVLDRFDSELSISTAATVIRGFRIMRIFRLVKGTAQIGIIIETFMNIIPQITNIMSLILLLFFIYSALGINLFSTVMHQEELNEKNNFMTFSNAMLLLMRCLTGEDWNKLMHELANEQDVIDCVYSQSYEEIQRDGLLGCGQRFSYIYFISFQVLIQMLIMNLSVAAVIEGLCNAKKENSGIVKGEQIN